MCPSGWGVKPVTFFVAETKRRVSCGFELWMRTSTLVDAPVDSVVFGADGFHVAATVDHTARARELGVGFDRAGGKKRIRADGVIVERSSDAARGS